MIRIQWNCSKHMVCLFGIFITGTTKSTTIDVNETYNIRGSNLLLFNLDNRVLLFGSDDRESSIIICTILERDKNNSDRRIRRTKSFSSIRQTVEFSQ
jgi:hypothetical protein